MMQINSWSRREFVHSARTARANRTLSRRPTIFDARPAKNTLCYTLPPHRTAAATISSSAENKALVADILLGTAVVTGAVTVVLLLTGGHEKESKGSAPVSLHATARGVGVTF